MLFICSGIERTAPHELCRCSLSVLLEWYRRYVEKGEMVMVTLDDRQIRGLHTLTLTPREQFRLVAGRAIVSPCEQVLHADCTETGAMLGLR